MPLKDRSGMHIKKASLLVHVDWEEESSDWDDMMENNDDVDEETD